MHRDAMNADAWPKVNLMQSIRASSVEVWADTDYGEGGLTFNWPDELFGQECLSITLDGHCSRMMPIYSGSGIERIELSRDRIRLCFTPALAVKLNMEPEIEIMFSITEAVFAELVPAIDFLNGEEDAAELPIA